MESGSGRSEFTSAVERVYEGYLVRVEGGERLDFEAYCKEHPEQADELLRLHALMRRLQEALPGPALSERGKQDESGTTVGPYVLAAELGRGGQSVVYLAQDTRLGRRVALKVLQRFDLTGQGSSSPSGPLARMRREAEIVSKLEHPGICVMYEFGEHGGRPYLAMRYVEGETLEAKISRSRKLRLDAVAIDSTGASLAQDHEKQGGARRRRLMRIVHLVEVVARALHSAHQAGVIHRDIKPANVMIGPEGMPVVLDFGLAFDGHHDASPLTLTGEIMGSPPYMAPEQIRGRPREVDRRTDVHALGVVLFECATLQRPFSASTRESLLMKILAEEAPDPRSLNSSIDRDLGVVIAKALEKSPQDRYPSALALAEDLRRIREREPILARRAGWLVRARRWMQRNPWRAASAAAVLLAAAAIARSVTLETSEKTRQRSDAAVEAGFQALLDDSEPPGHRPGARGHARRGSGRSPACRGAGPAGGGRSTHRGARDPAQGSSDPAGDPVVPGCRRYPCGARLVGARTRRGPRSGGMARGPTGRARGLRRSAGGARGPAAARAPGTPTPRRTSAQRTGSSSVPTRSRPSSSAHFAAIGMVGLRPASWSRDRRRGARSTCSSTRCRATARKGATRASSRCPPRRARKGSDCTYLQTLRRIPVQLE